MDLKCKLRHLYGRTVDVNGTRYAVAADGVVRGLKPDDASKLLQSIEAWAVLDTPAPALELQGAPIRTPVVVSEVSTPDPAPALSPPPSAPPTPPPPPPFEQVDTLVVLEAEPDPGPVPRRRPRR